MVPYQAGWLLHPKSVLGLRSECTCTGEQLLEVSEARVVRAFQASTGSGKQGV